MKINNGTMDHVPSATVVFQSTDYSQFRMIKGNRDLDMNKIKRILGEIERGVNLLPYCPILVTEKNGKLDIDDGQHRFAVSKKIKSPVYYIVAEDLSLYDIARMNSNQEKWKAKDFVNCYTELGNLHYKKLDEFMKLYPQVPVTTAVSLLERGRVHYNVGNRPGNGYTNNFQTGKFEVKHEEEAKRFLQKVAEFNVPFKFNRQFMQAIEKVITADKYPVADLIERVNEEPEALQMHHDYKNYLVNLETIANKRMRNRVIIH